MIRDVKGLIVRKHNTYEQSILDQVSFVPLHKGLI
jgi:hypothetical protein